ncbi:MAG: hypothetical protein ACKVOB_11985, partial [Sphingomonas sp.]
MVQLSAFTSGVAAQALPSVGRLPAAKRDGFSSVLADAIPRPSPRLAAATPRGTRQQPAGRGKDLPEAPGTTETPTADAKPGAASRPTTRTPHDQPADRKRVAAAAASDVTTKTQRATNRVTAPDPIADAAQPPSPAAPAPTAEPGSKAAKLGDTGDGSPDDAVSLEGIGEQSAIPSFPLIFVALPAPAEATTLPVEAVPVSGTPNLASVTAASLPLSAITGAAAAETPTTGAADGATLAIPIAPGAAGPVDAAEAAAIAKLVATNQSAPPASSSAAFVPSPAVASGLVFDAAP